MNLFLLQQYQFMNTLYRNDSYIDILCNIDELFDSLGLYVYPNWYECEIVDLKFYKYFIEILLRSPLKKMPHPHGGNMLTKYGCEVKYHKTKDLKARDIESRDDVKWSTKLSRYIPKLDEEEVWIVSCLIPNKYIMTDNVYDIKSIQQKLDLEQETDSSLSADLTTTGLEENE